MVTEIRTIYSCGLNKGFGSKFYMGFRVRHETLAVAYPRYEYAKHTDM